MQTSTVCNNNCVFCLDRTSGRLYYGGPDPLESRIVAFSDKEDLRRVLVKAAADVDEIAFTSGEPTLNKDLPQLIRIARESGYQRIMLVTNGTQLADVSLCESLLSNGLNVVNVSIHGHTAKLHDALTRRAGSFAQTVSGLWNLHSFKERYSFSFNTLCVVTKRNCRHIPSILEFFSQFEPDGMQLNPVMPEGAALENFGEVIPRLRAVALQVGKYASGAGARGPFLSIQHLPPCLLAGKSLDPKRIGLIVENEILGRDLRAGERPAKCKRAECSSCVFAVRCGGVWSRYVERFGWGEFRPVLKGARRS